MAAAARIVSAMRRHRTFQQSGKPDAIEHRTTQAIAVQASSLFGFCSTMHERASSLLERPEGFFGRNGRKYFDIVEWIFRFGW